ncbi:hypothetical protein BDZ89DRAFT_1173894 [Hymenopellis radicata]|nr:hypothetical protein BDZ89DRAFT_1173894 [Hymenopellis radicata]
MRADLNAQGMDLGHFVFAPYAGMAVCVCITDDLADFAAEHHLRAVNIPARIHPVNVSDDAALESPLITAVWTDRDIQVAEQIDAGLDGRPLAPYEQAMGLYPGFSKVMHLVNKYWREHPEVSAVRSARVADE